jgi:hemerythrin
MAKLKWSADLNTGIEVIDKQHKVIVDYINQLDDARATGLKKEAVGKVIDDLADYTTSHFSFEESMQEEAKYPFLKAHQKVHELFVRRVAEYQNRFKKGEDISEELHSLMFNWLYGHIKSDDADYIASVKQNLSQHEAFIEKKKGLFSRLFS